MATSISDGVVRDHAELGEFYDRYNKATDADTKERWANAFRWELARHSVGEELVLYPAFEKYLGNDGKKIAEGNRAAHQKIKEGLYQLESMKASDPNHKPTFDKLFRDLSEHVKDEESSELPKLEGVLPRDESHQMAKSFARTKKFVPTHSHPSAPNRPPYETAAGLLAAPIDRLRDLFTKFPEDDEQVASEARAKASGRP
jgi:hemerythrin superfamily protein